MKDKRKPLSERLPPLVFARIHNGIGQASMCWENIDEAGEFDAKKAGKIAFELCHFIADMTEKNDSVLPMCISKTGKPDEPLIETIICTAISGGTDYIDEMPRKLTLLRKLANGKEYTAGYTIQKRRK